MASFVLNVPSPVGPFGVEGDETGVRVIRLPHEAVIESQGTPPAPVARAAAQLTEYFAGERRHFDLELADVAATSFQREVWSALGKIPYGEVHTYAEVAAATGRPRASRAVGNANHANPWPVVVPCHRVVAATGLGGYGGGEEVKRFLLALEGVSFEGCTGPVGT